MRVSMSTIQLSERLLQTILPENHDSNCLLGCKRRCVLGNSTRLRGSRVRGPGLSSWPSSGTPLGSGWLRFDNQPGWAKPWIVHGW
jgi:hypothetical protein